MKHLLSVLISILIISLTIYYQDTIVSYVMEEIIYKRELPIYQNNNYYKDANYSYVNITDNFFLKNETDIKNAIYTVLNSGMNSYTLFCEEEYENCLNDVERITTDYDILSNINNFVHPYNSYDKLYITTNAFGKVDINVNKLYSEEEINEINGKIESIKQNIITNNMSTRDKIKAFHDYVINNTSYDMDRAEHLNNYKPDTSNQQSHKANGVLNNNIALCSGYTDLMAIFLHSINVPNYKISNDKHVWNAIFLDNTWYHLDLTWDDPITSTGENILIDDFFIITTEQLESLDIEGQHKYNKTVYGF